MKFPQKQALESFSLKLSVFTGGIVFLFSVLNRYSFLMMIFRTCLSFLFIYGLSQGFIRLWDSFSPPVKKQNQESSQIDVILGHLNSEDEEKSNSEDQDINPDPQSPLARAYGGVAGQINHHMQDGLQDIATKTDIIRRMGWEKDQGG